MVQGLGFRHDGLPVLDFGLRGEVVGPGVVRASEEEQRTHLISLGR